MRRLVLACLLAVACGPRLEPQHRVTDLRVLGVRAEAGGGSSADPSPGQDLVLRALVANPRGRPGAVVRWYGCVPTASESAGPCADLAVLADPGRLPADPRFMLLGACEPDASGECAVTVALPDVGAALEHALAVAERDPAFACRVYAEWPIVAVAGAEGREELALKRIRVVPSAEQLAARGLVASYAPNPNPVVSDVVRDRPRWGTCQGGIPVVPDPFPPGETTLCATGGGDDRFLGCTPGGALVAAVERPAWQWFVTDGVFPEFEDGAGNADRNEPRFQRASGPFTLWVVVRDGRGGEAWLRRDVGAAQ